MALPLGASFTMFVARVVDLEGRIAELGEDIAGKMTVYRWRPTAMPELPALWNWIPTGTPFEQRDQLRWRDTLTLRIVVGVPAGDTDEQLEAVEKYVDLLREHVDPQMAAPGDPFGGAAREAHRVSIQTSVDTFNEIPVLTVEADLQARFDRHITREV